MSEFADEGIIGPVDALRVPRFADHSTFARLPRIEDVERADAAVVGVPFDAGTTYRPGARFGPSHIRQSSRLLRPWNPALEVGPWLSQQVVDAGDIPANPFDIGTAIGEIATGSGALLDRGLRLVTMGGDHTVALPLLRALHQRSGPVALVHFDAHLDTWDTYFGQPYTHGTPFRRAFEEGLLLTDSSMHVGTRSTTYAATDMTEDAEMGFKVITSADVERQGVDAVASRIRERVGAHPLYLSIDIDVLDPAFAPATGTPEAGGLSSRELLCILRSLAGHELVGADVVEVSPAYDHAEITGLAAAHVIYELLSLMVT